jgi:hypothetical protein
MSWLYEQLKVNNAEWESMFALNSTMNWMKALAYEITQEYGKTEEEQVKACRNIFANVTPCKNKPELDIVFGPLFHSLVFVESIQSVNCMEEARPWMFASEIVKWYYSVYNSFKTILAAFSGKETDTHAAMIKALNAGNLRKSLPYPFNMLAKWEKNEEYSIVFENTPMFNRQKNVLREAFRADRHLAKSMILEYLSGTTKYETERVKKEILKHVSYTDFRTKVAKQDRDKRLAKELNFLTCAFRYRGKANYRDSVFLAYGNDDKRLDREYLKSLQVVAKFSFICALVYTEKRIGKKTMITFLQDIKDNFRGKNIAKEDELFWKKICDIYLT